MVRKLWEDIQSVFERNRYVELHSSSTSLDAKVFLQILVAFAFLVLSAANILSKSYLMLALTGTGCLVNCICALYAKKVGKASICANSSIITCSLLFGFFVVYGGNDGFACLWVVLLPFLAMVVMDFIAGLCASVFFQVFLIVLFWTPLRGMLPYQYNDQFCLRFPLFFFVTFILGLALTVSLRKSQYNECRHLEELEEMTAAAHEQARLDSLTELANRRCAYEEFDARFSADDQPHCIVMGDIDHFKRVNDAYGHEFGDEVLVVLASYIKELLPPDYFKSRWGGEEFLFAANEPLDTVFGRVEQLRKVISMHEFDVDGAVIRVTVTFGIAEYNHRDEIPEAINRADSRLYNGKKASRNCTIITD